MLLGAPTLKLRGDYLAIVTLGFGEIIRVFMNNLEYPINITNGPRGIGQIEPMKIGSWTSANRCTCSATSCPRSPCTTTCSWPW
jgi:ABC-type branched-subunit amino acid transport system permease subunit